MEAKALVGLSGAVRYGGQDWAPELLALASGIRTFTEQTIDQEVLNEIKGKVLDAETIVFLGFAFHDINMELMTLAARGRASRIFATAFGMSGSQVGIARQKILEMLHTKSAQVRIEFLNGTCSSIFDEFSDEFSRRA